MVVRCEETVFLKAILRYTIVFVSYFIAFPCCKLCIDEEAREIEVKSPSLEDFNAPISTGFIVACCLVPFDARATRRRDYRLVIYYHHHDSRSRGRLK